MRANRIIALSTSRRAILGPILVLSCVITAAGAEPTRMPLMMPDDFDELHAVAWRVELATPDRQNPLLEGEMPWDAGGVMSHGTVLRDPLDGLWKAWLVCTPAEETLDEVATRNHYFRRLCYFESNDGMRWRRPQLPNSSFGEYEATNIVFDDTDSGGTQYASVIVSPEQRDWPYEMFVYRQMYGRPKPRHTHLHHYRSRDGKAWELIHGPIKGPMTSDVCFVYSDGRGGYVSYYRLGAEDDADAHLPVYESRGPRTRQLFRAVSPDGKEWLDSEKIIKRDDRDHRDTQYMELVPHQVPGGYLGVVSIYRPITQTLNLRVAASRDGRSWWFPDRRPCLDNAALGDYGGGMIWQSRNLIVEGNALYVYYGASEGIHRPIFDTRAKEHVQVGLDRIINYPAGFYPFNSALCRASWRFDRLYALVPAAGGPTLGIAVTKPQELEGKRLRVNLVTRPPKRASRPGLDEGYLQVELLDAGGKPLPGFTRDDCPPLRGDHAALKVQWTGGDQAPERASQARFYLKRAFLYGFAFRLPTP